MTDVFDDLARFARPRSQVPYGEHLAALDGQPSAYDVDGIWRAHHMGHPRCATPGAFGEDELMIGARTIAFLSAMLPVGAPRRSQLPALYRKICERLNNPELLVYGGCPWNAAVSGSEALLHSGNYLYFRPAYLRAPADIATCEQHNKLDYPNELFPWSSNVTVWQTFVSPGFAALVERIATTPVPEGSYEIDPRRSAPALVAEVAGRHQLGEDAATLFLQLLTLIDCGDAWLTEVNGWTAKRHRAAGDELVRASLVVEKKQPRANRRYALAGLWETLKSPNPAVERDKLPLYGAEMRGEALAAPLGRLLLLRPVHELFAEALERFTARTEAAPKRKPPDTRDWLAEIASSPDDEQLRLVYADWLSERGDPRGEFIAVQTQRAELEASAAGGPDRDSKLAELRAVESALLEHHRVAWTEAIHPFVKDIRFDRGFIVGVTAHPPTLVKHASQIFDAAPLIRELVIDAGPVGPVPTAHWRALVACEQFARIRHLDTTPDHYIATEQDLALVLAGPHTPKLRWLRLGFHRTNEGLGLRGIKLLAGTDRLDELRFLELAGQNAGIQSVRALLTSQQLSRLEVLRLPYNALTDAHAHDLADRLRRGAAPALRVLDLSNDIAVEFVTAAVKQSANQVSPAAREELAGVLAARR